MIAINFLLVLRREVSKEKIIVVSVIAVYFLKYLRLPFCSSYMLEVFAPNQRE